ncbi:MAG: copper resistance protein CopD [Thaumarchaeota archaeon]|nr:copper resistance protein CopD [Nitrososphaerota archaeon]
MKNFLLVLLLISSVGFPLAYAHPFTVTTNPAQSSNVLPGITQIIVHYSEALEVNFSELKVFDSNGNQIDNKDTAYFEGENSLVVTTSPLEEGVYTVTSKVLSKIDGHLVDYAFVFGVGNVRIDTSLIEQQGSSETLFFPEAGARYPGLVGQTIVLGAVISSLLIWNIQKRKLVKEKFDQIEQTFHHNFMKLIGFGLIIVFASNILMLFVQTLRLQISAIDALQTSFGNTWLIRMGLTIILLALWFAIERKPRLTMKGQIPILVVSLALIATTTMIGHGVASEHQPAIILDYVHNLVASVWIGGIIFFGFVLLPTLSRLDENKKEKFLLSLIPRFSIIFVISVGIIIIVGPLLLWFLESNVGLLLESTYGMLIIAKITIAAFMISIGGYNQFKIQKSAEKNLKSGSLFVHKKLGRSLKIESVLGIALLGIVALLVNGSLPAGEINQVQAQEITYGFSTTQFADQAKFDISIVPFSSGTNTISVTVSDFNGNLLDDINGVKIKVSNSQRNIAPIDVIVNEIKDEKGSTIRYDGDLTFGFFGSWQIEIEALRTQNANEVTILDVLIKPRLAQLKTEIIEYEFPEAAKPLYPFFDGKDSIWISDPSKPRVWKFNLANQEFESFEFDGQVSVMIAGDSEGKIWFTDPPSKKIGFIDPKTGKIELIQLDTDGVIVGLETDQDNIWIAVFDKNILLRYDQNAKTFEEYPVPTEVGGPFALRLDSEGNLWFTESLVGKIAVLDTKTGEIKEFVPNTPLKSPEALFFDSDGNLWIAEHAGLSIVKFDTVLETFEKISVPDSNSLPFGMTQDRHGNIWFAQHTVDRLGVYDPYNDDLIEVELPTAQSFTQFMTSDDKDNVWFVEQQGNKIGLVKITESTILQPIQMQTEKIKISYAEFVSPLISMGIIATSLFFVKSIRDKRRIDSLLE